MKNRTVVAALILILCLVLYSPPSLQAGPDKCPGGTRCFGWGFINAQATIHTPDPQKRFRVRVTSMVFSFCGLETSTEKIAKDAHDTIYADLLNRYGTDNSPEITYMFVSSFDTSEKADEGRRKANLDAQYRDHIETRYMYNVYSSKCHN